MESVDSVGRNCCIDCKHWKVLAEIGLTGWCYTHMTWKVWNNVCDYFVRNS